MPPKRSPAGNTARRNASRDPQAGPLALLPPPSRPGRQRPCSEETRLFLEQHAPRAVLEVFPEWQGILLHSRAVDRPLWIVRTRTDGEQLAEQTGQAALLLADILAQGGKGRAEANTVLTQLLILPPGEQERAESSGQQAKTKAPLPKP